MSSIFDNACIMTGLSLVIYVTMYFIFPSLILHTPVSIGTYFQHDTDTIQFLLLKTKMMSYHSSRKVNTNYPLVYIMIQSCLIENPCNQENTVYRIIIFMPYADQLKPFLFYIHDRMRFKLFLPESDRVAVYAYTLNSWPHIF